MTSTKHILTAVLAEVEMTPVPAKMAVTDHLQAAVDTVTRSAKRLIRHAAASPSPAPNVPTEGNSDKYAANLHNAIARRMGICLLLVSHSLVLCLHAWFWFVGLFLAFGFSFGCWFGFASGSWFGFRFACTVVYLCFCFILVGG